MITRITLFAAMMLCCISAMAQTLVGLPQHGVRLEGTAERPAVVNNSGKTIISVVIVRKRSDGFSFTDRPLIIDPGAEIKSGGSWDVLRSSHMQNPKPGTSMVSASLDLVVFSDGLVVGPDTNNSFDVMQKRISAIREVGGSDFAKIQTLANDQVVNKSDIDKKAAARSYMSSKNGAALLKHYLSLPATLRKEN